MYSETLEPFYKSVQSNVHRQKLSLFSFQSSNHHQSSSIIQHVRYIQIHHYIYIMICHIYRYTTYINIPHYKYRYTTIYPIYIQYIVPGRGDLSARCAACRALRGQLPLDDQLRPLHAVAADALMVRVTGPVTGSVVRGFSIGLPWTTLW